MTHKDTLWHDNPDDLNSSAGTFKGDVEVPDPDDEKMYMLLEMFYSTSHEEDAGSLQRAWERIAREGSHAFPSQRRARRIQSAPLASRRLARPVRRIHSSLRILAACLVACVLVGSMLGMIALHNTKSSGPASQRPSPSATPVRVLGNTLGPLSLGMSQDEVRVIMEKASKVSSWKDVDRQSIMLQADKMNCEVAFSFLSPQKAVQLLAWGSFQGATQQGFRLGMTMQEFTQHYASFHLVSHERTSLPFPLFIKQGISSIISITDGKHITLWVVFDQQQRAIQMVLQSGSQAG